MGNQLLPLQENQQKSKSPSGTNLYKHLYSRKTVNLLPSETMILLWTMLFLHHQQCHAKEPHWVWPVCCLAATSALSNQLAWGVARSFAPPTFSQQCLQYQPLLAEPLKRHLWSCCPWGHLNIQHLVLNSPPLPKEVFKQLSENVHHYIFWSQ